METELVNYIKNARSHNLSDAEIKKNLLGAGWEATEVDEAFAHVKAIEHQPPVNRDEDLHFEPIRTSEIGPTSPEKATTAHANITITEEHFQAPSKLSIFKKPLLWLALVIILLAAGGYAFYVYSYNNPTKVWKKFLKVEKNQVYQSKFTLSYIDSNKLENEDVSNSLNLSDVKLAFEGNSYLDSTDLKNPQSSADVQYTFGSGNTSFSTGFKYRLINKILYVNIGENPFLNTIINSLNQGKKIEWLKLDLNALENEMNKSDAQDQAKFSEIFSPSLQKELSKLWEDATLVKLEKYLGKEKLNGVNTFHFKNTIDKQAVKDVLISMMTKIMNALKEKGEKIEDKDLETMKTVTTALVNKVEINEFETWVGARDFRLYRVKFASNAPSIVSLIETSIGSARGSSRDAKRLADIRQLASALELYFNDFGRYPDSREGKPVNLASKYYIGVLPEAPLPSDGNCTDYYNAYWYEVKNNGQAYEMTFCIGRVTGGYGAGILKLTPAGIQPIEGCTSKPENCYKDINKPYFSESTLASEQEMQKSEEEKINDFISKLSFSAKFSLESNYSGYDKVQKLEAPENPFDLMELFKTRGGDIMGAFRGN